MYANPDHLHDCEKKLRFRRKDLALLEACAEHVGLEPAVFIRELVLEGLRLQLAVQQNGVGTGRAG